MRHLRILPILLFAAAPAVLVAACGSDGSSGSGAGGAAASGSSSSSGEGVGGTLFAGSGGASGTGGAAATSSTGAGAADGGLGDFCKGSGAIPIPGAEDCTGDIGKKTFLFAACSCTSFDANNTVDTDSFNSNDPNKPLAGGSIGVNGNYSAQAATNIKGALLVKGSITTANAHDVVQDMECGGTAKIGHTALAESNATIVGAVDSSNKELTINGKFFTPLAGNPAKVNALGGVVVGPASVKEPCDCKDLVDVAGIVKAFAGSNDNATNNVDPDVLTANPSMPTEITLPCGRYHLKGIQSNSTVTVHLTGRTVLAVDGDIAVAGKLVIDLAPKAELDLFVSGNVALTNQAAIGDQARPAATRAYIGGEQVALSGQLLISANLYMASAALQASNDLEIWGAVFAKSISSANHFKVHYDEAIINIDGCQPGGSTCTDCHDCVNPNPSCGPSGTCGPCKVDKDCCGAMICLPDGTCAPPPPK